MAVSFSKFLGHDSKADELPAQLRAILSQMRHERTAFETTSERARESAQQLGQLAEPIAEAHKTVTELQSRVKALERLVPVLATLDEQTETVAKVQRRAETQLSHVSEDAKRLRAELDELRGGLEAAISLKQDLASFLEMGGGFKALRLEADGLTAQLRDFTQGLERARERQEELRRASDASTTRLNAFEERHQQTQAGVAAIESRLGAFEPVLKHVSGVTAEAVETKRQLGTLKALADYVAQKVSALEQQREVVDRALSQATHFTDVMRDLDGKIRQHEESAKSFGVLEARVHELNTLHAGVLERAEQISAHHEEIRHADQELHGRLTSLRDEVQRSVKRFEMEHQGLDAVGQRILDLRGAVTDMESRFRTLDESSRIIADVRSRADGLAAQLDGIAEGMGQLETQAARVGAIQASADRLSLSVDDMTGRAARLERVQPTVEAVLREFASLKGTQEAVTEAMEEMRVAEGDLRRTREGQAETQTWLAGVTTSVDALRREFTMIEELKPTVEAVRSEADRVALSVAQIESRRELVEGLNRRLTDLASAGTQLEERSRGLLTRMETADARFQDLAAHAEEAARIETLVPTTLATVERAARRATDVEDAVASMEARCRALEGLADRNQTLGEEVGRRQAALDKAAEHLERASKLREESATVAQQLEDRAGQLTGQLATAADRVTELTGTLDQLDSRAGNLRLAQQRMTQFEERLTKWQATELQLTRALEQFGQRQATLDAMRVDMHRLFEVAERTVEEVRSIAAAREEVSQTRAMLENVLALVGHAHDAANGLDHRKRQVEQAEGRLARVEALLADIQSSLETLHGQKAFLNQVIEKAGALEVHTRQAEVLIGTLREERGITDSVRAAVTQLRQERAVPGSA